MGKQDALIGFAACAFILVACSKNDFQQAQKTRETGTSAAPLADDGTQSVNGFDSGAGQYSPEGTKTTASEPIMVDGSYLVCFRDRHQESKQEASGEPHTAHIGCGLYKDALASERSSLGSESMSLEKVTAIGVSREMPVQIHKAPQSTRWLWTGTYAESETVHNLRVSASSPNTQFRTAILPLYDRLPPSTFLAAAETEIGPFQIRHAGTQTCMSGNPTWSYDASTGVASSSPLDLVECSKALSFRASYFQKGWYLHTHNPNPPPASQCIAQYGMNTSLCNRSCVDRADFGRSNRLQLWGCTTSVEAQSIGFDARQGFLAAFINTSGIGLQGSALFIINDSKQALEWELVSLVP